MSILLEYWSKFDPVEIYWHYLNGILYIMIGVLTLILNTLMISCLKKY